MRHFLTIYTSFVTKVSQLIHLARPQFSIASLLLFILGSLWALLSGEKFSLPRFVLGYSIILSTQLSVSFSNDYYDTHIDSLGTPALFSGGSGVLITNPELRTAARLIALSLIILSLGLGFTFCIIFSFPIAFTGIVAVANLLGWCYSATPLQLAYRGWGEITTTALIGALPGIGYFVTKGNIDQTGLLFTLPTIFYGLAFMLVVEIPDETTDRIGNKRTWVVRTGRKFSYYLVVILFFASTVYFFFLQWFTSINLPINTAILFFMSFIPLGVSFIGLLNQQISLKPVKVVNLVISSLVIFLFMLDLYFASLIKWYG